MPLSLLVVPFNLRGAPLGLLGCPFVQFWGPLALFAVPWQHFERIFVILAVLFGKEKCCVCALLFGARFSCFSRKHFLEALLLKAYGTFCGAIEG